MVVMPLTYGGQNRLANDINAILAKIRRGCAMARQESQNNPATNMMVDLPEGIDFEINALWSHQNASYQRTTTTTNAGNNLETESTLDAGTTSDSETTAGSESGSSSSSAGERD